MGKMRAKAGQLGCEGLIIVGGGTTVTGQGLAESTSHNYRGTCILFTEEQTSSATNATPPPSATTQPTPASSADETKAPSTSL